MLVTGREDDFAEQEAEAGGAPPTWLVKVKIMLGLFQIVGAMPWSLPTSRSRRLLPVVAWANYLNFDLLSWVPMECFGRFGYFDQLVSTTLAPLAGLGVVAVVTAARRATAAAADRRAEIYSQGTYAALLLTFCVLPGCSSITFRFLSCARYDAGDYEDDLLVLHADPAVECRGDRWNAWRGYVGLMLCVYPVGIPLSYFCVLYRLRRELDPALDDDRECDAIRTRDRAGSGFDDVDDMFAEARARYAAVVAQGRKIEARKTRHAKAVEPVACPAARIFDPTSTFLVEEYEPRCYLFSVFECFRRVALTGGLTVFAFGGATQAAMGLLISLVSYKVYAVAAPFIEDDDDLVSEVAQLELVFVFFSALMLVVADTAEGETSHARAIFSAFLGLAFALGLAVVVFIVAVELWGRDAVLAPFGVSAKVDDDDDEEEDGAAPPPLRDGVFPVAAFEPAGAAEAAARRRRAARRAKRRPAGAPAPAPDPDAPALSCWVGCFQPGDDDAPRARAGDGTLLSGNWTYFPEACRERGEASATSPEFGKGIDGVGHFGQFIVEGIRERRGAPRLSRFFGESASCYLAPPLDAWFGFDALPPAGAGAWDRGDAVAETYAALRAAPTPACGGAGAVRLVIHLRLGDILHLAGRAEGARLRNALVAAARSSRRSRARAVAVLSDSPPATVAGLLDGDVTVRVGDARSDGVSRLVSGRTAGLGARDLDVDFHGAGDAPRGIFNPTSMQPARRAPLHGGRGRAPRPRGLRRALGAGRGGRRPAARRDAPRRRERRRSATGRRDGGGGGGRDRDAGRRLGARLGAGRSAQGDRCSHMVNFARRLSARGVFRGLPVEPLNATAVDAGLGPVLALLAPRAGRARATGGARSFTRLSAQRIRRRTPPTRVPGYASGWRALLVEEEVEAGVFSRARDALAAGADADGDGPQPEATVLSRDPWVLQVDGFLSAAECDDAKATLHEHETLEAPDRRADEPYPRRTASYAWCLADCRRAPVFARLAARVAALGGCGSVNHTDSFHLAHLRPREQLGRHHDFLDDEVMRPGGPRLLAFKFFLDDVDDGGALRFPELGFDVAPRAGRALVYALVRGDDLLAPDLRTQVEYLPVWTAGPGTDASQILETWTHLHDYRGPHLHSCLGPHAAYDSELIGDQGAGAAPATPTPDDAK
ncbi:sulfotransferase [Aureococcus anophagefferens]|nr:sulfotransferase [Aureococcus anophagefferens]